MPETWGTGVDRERVFQILTLAVSRQDGRDGPVGALEARAYMTDQSSSDEPGGTSPRIAAFVCTWSDGLPQRERDELILPLLPRLIGTGRSETLERRRAALAVDWLVRVHLPAWFNLAKLNVEADELANLAELRGVGDLAALCDHLKRARRRAAIANLTLRQSGSPVRAAAWDAAHRAAWATIRDDLEAAGGRILAAGWDTAYAAAYAAARAYGKAPLERTRQALQHSARALVERMIAVDEEPGIGLPSTAPSP